MKLSLKKSLAITLALASIGSFNLSNANAMTNQSAYSIPTVQAKTNLYSNYLTSENWQENTKNTLNEFLQTYGKNSANYSKENRPYAVFDFDNTTSIMDIEEQLAIWQIDHLAFAVTPEQLSEVLKTGIPQDRLTATYGANAGEGTQIKIIDVIDDAVAAYTKLYNASYVSTTSSQLPNNIKNSDDFKEFSSKMRWLYDAISENMDTSISYPWITYWFTGMTPDEVYNLAYACDTYYSNPQQGQTWTKGSYNGPTNYKSKAGSVNISYNLGLTVSPEIKELYSALDKNGIDTWINSASQIDVVRAAVDFFQVPGVDGIVAMTNKLDDNGRYINEYNYDLHAQTQGVGKSLTIDKVIAPKYNGHGPIFTAMDSQGDFNFCTEYKDTKAVLILNRIRTDDAAICAGIAQYQEQNNIGLKEANLTGNTKYLLQGRNENTGKLWNSYETLRLGKTSNAYLSDKALKVIDELNQNKPINEVISENTSLKDYQGYKTR